MKKRWFFYVVASRCPTCRHATTRKRTFAVRDRAIRAAERAGLTQFHVEGELVVGKGFNRKRRRRSRA